MSDRRIDNQPVEMAELAAPTRSPLDLRSDQSGQDLCYVQGNLALLERPANTVTVDEKFQLTPAEGFWLN